MALLVYSFSDAGCGAEVGMEPALDGEPVESPCYRSEINSARYAWQY
jgi:hypothetical protein